MFEMMDALVGHIDAGPVWMAGGVVLVIIALGRRTAKSGRRMSD